MQGLRGGFPGFVFLGSSPRDKNGERSSETLEWEWKIILFPRFAGFQLVAVISPAEAYVSRINPRQTERRRAQPQNVLE
jgi:hypothetical protein